MKKLLILFMGFFIAGCVATSTPRPKLNPLQIQTMQSQNFTVSKKQAFNAVMTVFQNDGYIIQTADLDTGFITGKSPTSGNKSLAVTAFLTAKTKKTTHIRLNFVRHVVMRHRRMAYTKTIQVLNTSLYKKTFNDIRQQVFVVAG